MSIALNGNLLYVIGKLQEWSSAWNLSKIFDTVEDLRIVDSGKRKNSGYPGNQEIWGYGGIIVRNSYSGITIRKDSSLEIMINFILSSSDALSMDLESFDKQILEYLKVGKKIEGLSNILSNPKFLLLCYYEIILNKRFIKLNNRILSKIGLKWFCKISKSIQNGSYNFCFTKEKPTFKLTKKEISLDILKDSIIQEAIWRLLRLIYEKIFIDVSHEHGFNESCYTALNRIRLTMGCTIWFVKGDVSTHFNVINHNLLISKMSKIIKDQLFISLLYKILCIKYRFLNKEMISTYMRFPEEESNILLLFNILLYNFDRKILDFAKLFKRGSLCENNSGYIKLIKERNHLIYSKLHSNVKFKELKYVRYMNNFLIGIIGSKRDCIKIRLYIKKLLKEEFKFEFNINRIEITYAKKDNTFFLGHNIYVLDFPKDKLKCLLESGKKFAKIDAPIKKIISELSSIGYCKSTGSPTRFGKLIHEPITEIILRYKILQSGLLNYYSIASNYKYVCMKIHYILKYSCALTIANKMKLKTLKKIFSKFSANLEIKNKKKVIIQSYPTVSYSKPKNSMRIWVFDPFDYIKKSFKLR